MESNSVCNPTSCEQNRTITKRESDLLITSMITDGIGRHENRYQLKKGFSLEAESLQFLIFKPENAF